MPKIILYSFYENQMKFIRKRVPERGKGGKWYGGSLEVNPNCPYGFVVYLLKEKFVWRQEA
ncbi:MAG: hypothetical protein GXO05_00255 [Aquificae bacterium]|nr:hypothetical protein [Aquificota bacterium]